MNSMTILSPVNGERLLEYPFATAGEIEHALKTSQQAQTFWQSIPLEARISQIESLIDKLMEMSPLICEEVTHSMGRPIHQVPGELAGMKDRAQYMMRIASEVLKSDDCEAPIWLSSKPAYQVKRSIEKLPLGVVLVIAPWNYPYLTVVNSVIPALLAGNSVILKHSPQTVLCGQRWALAAKQSQLPEGLLQHLNLNVEDTASLISNHIVQGVSFTGSVEVGQKVYAQNHHFMPMNLELGGKDAAWVRADADLDFAAQQLADGAFFNSGQSCCAIERIFVDKAVEQPFLEKFYEQVANLVIGNPFEPSTTMGPVAQKAILERIASQVKEATAMGAQVESFGEVPTHGYYSPAQVATNVSLEMALMQEESFGPIVGIMAVDSDQQAIEAINQSKLGLTASIWTQSHDIQTYLSQLQVGTTFVNHCDYLDPSLPWSGQKLSGMGASLSRYGFDAFIKKQSQFVRFGR